MNYCLFFDQVCFDVNSIKVCGVGASLTPRQSTMTIKQKQNCDYYAQYFLKHRACAKFTSKYMLLFAGLLESDINTASFVPRPFTLRIGKSFFTPSFYANQLGRKCVIHIASQSLGKDLSEAITEFFYVNGYSFTQISSEEVYSKKVLALNWLDIVKRLYVAKTLFVEEEKCLIRQFLNNYPDTAIFEFIDAGNRTGTMKSEIALCQLIYEHSVVAELDSRRLNYDTKLRLAL